MVQMLMEPNDFREKLSEELRAGQLHIGLETEKIVTVLLDAAFKHTAPDANSVSGKLGEYERRLLFDIAFEGGANATWEEAQSCLEVLRRRRSEEELAAVQRQIEACAGATSSENTEQLRALQERKLELRRRLASTAG